MSVGVRKLQVAGAARHGWLASNSDTATAVCRPLCVWGVQAFARVRAHACAFVHACVRACVRCLQYTIKLFDTG